MRINQNTSTARLEQPPAPIYLPTDPTVPWPAYLDKVSTIIQESHTDPRAWMVAAIVREAASVAHIQNLDLFEHQQLLLDTEDYEPTPDDGPAAPTAGGIGWGSDSQWDLCNL